MESVKNTRRQTEDFLTIQDLWYLCLGHLHWFLMSFVVCIGLACYYLIVTPNVYTREAAILVKQEVQGKNAGKSANGEEFNDLGMVQQITSVNNVQRQLSSLEVLTEVVRRMGLAENKRDVMREAQYIQRNLKTEIDGDKSTIINLKFTALSPEYAETVLSTIVDVYNEQWIRNKNEMTANTSRFIEERLSLLEYDLGNVDDSISNFKARNKITDLDRVSDIYLQQQSASDAQILSLTNQRAMASYILGILKDKDSQHQLLPTNSGINNSVAESQITQYNNMLLILKNNMYSTSGQNPLIIKQESDLTDIRNNIVATINNQIKSIDIQLKTYQTASGEASSKITQNPNQAKYLLSIERDQKVKESLYLYLLQKKEENEISMTYTSCNTQMIDMPHGSEDPTSPSKRNVLLGAILLSLLVPIAVLFARESMNNSVRDKYDIERKTNLSLIGEIPEYVPDNVKTNKLFRKFRREKNDNVTSVVVAPDRRDIVNEAFRIIRSNLEFMTSHHGSKNVYVVTSDYEGSGKTFVSTNLSTALAIKGHKVLLIDGDLRHASASHRMECQKKGLADYLSEKYGSVDEVIMQHKDYPTLSILPVGNIPPNPTELLSSTRFGEMLDELRPQYDFIIIDCPPAETLADVSIIERHADRTLFIVRAGMFDRKRIYDLEEDAQNGKYKNLSLILNVSNVGSRYSYRGRYGYKYAYHYGKSYSYHNA